MRDTLWYGKQPFLLTSNFLCKDTKWAIKALVHDLCITKKTINYLTNYELWLLSKAHSNIHLQIWNSIPKQRWNSVFLIYKNINTLKEFFKNEMIVTLTLLRIIMNHICHIRNTMFVSSVWQYDATCPP